MSVASRYLGEFRSANSGTLVIVQADTDPAYVQYLYGDNGRSWRRMRTIEWTPQVDRGGWIPAIPEELRVSEGL